MTTSSRPTVATLRACLAAALLIAASAASAQGGYNILCAGNPPPPHVNGAGQTFDSCSPLGTPGNAATYSLALAQAARAAWPYPGADTYGTCASRPTHYALLRKTASSCAVWVYGGPLAGYVKVNSANSTCSCPTSSDPIWK